LSTLDWQTVVLTKPYLSPIVVCSPLYAANAPSVSIRMRNVTSNSFEARIIRVDNGPMAVTGMMTKCLVVEEGVYTPAVHGVKLEAVRYESTVTDSRGSWEGEGRTYSNGYSDPVVVGQVMTSNDSAWSVFWARGGSMNEAPSPDALYTGKHVGEDPNRSRQPETVGYIVIESGSGLLDGLTYEAGVGPETVRGRDNNPPYVYPLSLTQASAAVVASAGMYANDGGWPVLVEPDPFPAGALHLMIDEDRLGDSERRHAPARVAYVAFSDAPAINNPPTATPQALSTPYETALALTLTGSDPDSDPLTFTVVDGPLFGVLSGAAPSLLYTPNPGFWGSDSFTFSVDDGRGGVDQAVISISVAAPIINQPPTADPQALSTPHATALAITLTGSDPDFDLLTFAIDAPPANGSLSGAAPNVTYTPNSGFSGSDSFLFSVSDGRGGVDQAEVTILVAAPPSEGPLRAEVVTALLSTVDWVSVPLVKTYISPVIACSPLYAANDASLIVRMRNVGPTGFELRAVRVDRGPRAVFDLPTQCLVVEEGVYKPEDHGIRLEAVRYESTVTDHMNAWSGEVRSYANLYTNPVVVGQVMTANDAEWSVFWARGESVDAPPSSTALFTGKHIGEDRNQIRVAETVGYIVMETGLGSLDGLSYEAAVGPMTIRGRDNSPPFSYPLALSNVSAGVVAAAGIYANDGGWPVLLAPDPFPPGEVLLMMDEDRLRDPERGHPPARVAYVVFAEP
jgi:hypothetical protein